MDVMIFIIVALVAGAIGVGLGFSIKRQARNDQRRLAEEGAAETRAGLKDQIVHDHGAGEMAGKILDGQRGQCDEHRAVGDDQEELRNGGRPLRVQPVEDGTVGTHGPAPQRLVEGEHVGRDEHGAERRNEQAAEDDAPAWIRL